MKPRYIYIDLLKVIAIFMVITLHIPMWNTNFIGETDIQSFILKCCSFSLRIISEGVLIFMLVNGYLLFSRECDIKKIYNKIIKIFVLIIIWSLTLSISLPLISGESLTFEGVLLNILNTNISNPYTGVLWFLQHLIPVYLFFPFIKYLYDNKFQYFKYLLIALFVGNYGIKFVILINNLLNSFIHSEILNSCNFFLSQYHIYVIDTSYIFYFILGGYLYRIKRTLNSKVIIIGVASYIFSIAYAIVISTHNNSLIADNYLYEQLPLIFIFIAIFYTFFKLESKMLSKKDSVFIKTISSIGNNTMGIYLIHKIIIYIIDYKIIHLNDCAYRIQFFIAISILLGSWGIALIIRKIPKLRHIISL